MYAEFEFSGGNWGGSLKLLGKNKGYASPSSSAFVCAHDVMEHTEQDRGSLENEMRALGVAPITRANKMPGRYVGTDIGYVMAGHCTDRGLRKAPEVPEKFTVKELEMFRDMEEIARGENRVVKVYKHIPSAMEWVRFGYYLGKKRYPNRELAAQTFDRLEYILMQCLNGMHHGWKVRLMVDPVYGTISSQIVGRVDEGDFIFDNAKEARDQLRDYSQWRADFEENKYAEKMGMFGKFFSIDTSTLEDMTKKMEAVGGKITFELSKFEKWQTDLVHKIDRIKLPQTPIDFGGEGIVMRPKFDPSKFERRNSRWTQNRA